MNNLKPGITIELDGHPYEVLEATHQKKARGNATVSVKLRNLRTEKTRETTFHSSDEISAASVERKEAIFHHRTRDKFVFSQDDKMVSLPAGIVKGEATYLKKELPVTIVYISNKPEKIRLPIKAEYAVAEAPPNVRGDTAQSGTKEIVLETGTRIKTPLFIERGDIIEVNTQTGEYVRRTNK